MWTGAILAGGRSRRLGGLNKSRLVLHSDGGSILDRQLAHLRPVVDRTVIIANDPEPFRHVDVPVIADILPNHGAIGGLYTAVAAAHPGPVLVLACDMPFVTTPFLEHLISVSRSADVVIPRTARGYEPLCATYSQRCRAALQQLAGEGRFKLAEIVSMPGLAVRELGPDELEPFGPEEVLFFNVNTPDDYARAIDLDGEYH